MGRSTLTFVLGVALGAGACAVLLWQPATTPGSPEGTPSGAAGAQQSDDDVRDATPERPRRERTAATPSEDPAEPGSTKHPGKSAFDDGTGYDWLHDPKHRPSPQDVGRSPGPVNRAAERLLRQCRDAAVRHQGTTDTATVNRLLESTSPADRRRAVGLALRADPPLSEILRKIATDPSFGSLRSAALLGLVRSGAPDENVRATVIHLTRDGNPHVRRTAVETLRDVGDGGIDRALELLRSGAFSSEELPGLAHAVAGSGSVRSYLASRPPPRVAFAVLTAVAVRVGSDAELRTQIGPALPGIVGPLLESRESDFASWGAIHALARTGHGEFLRTVALSSAYSTWVRRTTLRIAVETADTRQTGIDALVILLDDFSTPSDLLRAAIGLVSDALAAEPRIAASLEILATSHANPWVRRDAAGRMKDKAPKGAGDLVVHTATYGKSGRTVDVTHRLREMIVLDRLRVRSGNELAGDPAPGITKDLVVEYSFHGRRSTRTAREGSTLSIP